jgi:hypothetical protein
VCLLCRVLRWCTADFMSGALGRRSHLARKVLCFKVIIRVLHRAWRQTYGDPLIVHASRKLKATASFEHRYFDRGETGGRFQCQLDRSTAGIGCTSIPREGWLYLAVILGLYAHATARLPMDKQNDSTIDSRCFDRSSGKAIFAGGQRLHPSRWLYRFAV